MWQQETGKHSGYELALVTWIHHIGTISWSFHSPQSSPQHIRHVGYNYNSSTIIPYPLLKNNKKHTQDNSFLWMGNLNPWQPNNYTINEAETQLSLFFCDNDIAVLKQINKLFICPQSWKQCDLTLKSFNWKWILLSYHAHQPESTLFLLLLAILSSTDPPALHFFFRKEQAFKRWQPNRTKLDIISQGKSPQC